LKFRYINCSRLWPLGQTLHLCLCHPLPITITNIVLKRVSNWAISCSINVCLRMVQTKKEHSLITMSLWKQLGCSYQDNEKDEVARKDWLVHKISKLWLSPIKLLWHDKFGLLCIVYWHICMSGLSKGKSLCQGGVCIIKGACAKRGVCIIKGACAKGGVCVIKGAYTIWLLLWIPWLFI
jgi:hypothetical protein